MAIALSLANLCFLRTWSELLTFTGSDAYTMRLPFSPAAYASAVCDVLLAGAMLVAAILLVRRAGPRIANFAGRAVLAAACAAAANAVRSVLANRYTFLRSELFDMVGTRGAVLLGAGLGTLGVLLLWQFRRRLIRLGASVLLALSPLVPLVFAQAAWRAATYDASAYRDGALAQVLSGPETPRVLWVVLDEWDQRLTFIERPAGIQLPEIDRFRRESLAAENAYSPGPETPVSMPALITGRMVKDVVRRGPRELQLLFPDGSSASWSRVPNVFGAARAAGFNTALVGWYHPYCRVLSENLTDCAWWPMNMQYNSNGDTVPELMVNQARSLLETSLLSVFGQSLPARAHARTYREMLDRARSAAVDPRLGLTLLHLPVPHAPHTFDRTTGRFDLGNAPIRGYLDSLVLADRAIGEIRRELERSGLWERTTVLFTTDHSYRSGPALDGKKDHRIPFLLKVAGKPEAVRFTAPFNTLLTRDLLLAILRREVASTSQAAAWIERHRTIADSPYNHN